MASAALCVPQQWVKLSDAEKVDTSLKFEPYQSDSEVQTRWNSFKDTHGKTYEPEEEEMRRKIYETNMKKIDLHNYLYGKGMRSFTLGENEYTDLEHHEFVSIMNGYRRDTNDMYHDNSTYMSPLVTLTIPDDVDWRTEGYVTPVKNQGQCGSCWSFSATGSLEGQTFRKTGKLISLSEQNLVDCSGKWGNDGCNGGLMDNAFQYIKDNNGLDTEDCYPYTAEEGKCHYRKKCADGHDVGFTDLPEGDEDKLKEAVASIGPISIAIDASHESFQLYKGGVYDEPECSSTQLDHGVLIVGYGTDSDTGADYWLVKNSWGETWGEQGYIKMTRNKDNQCGVASKASYPVV